MNNGNSNHDEREARTVYVGELTSDVDEDVLRSYFEHIGSISEIRLKRENSTNNPRHYGFVEFSTIEERQRAIRDMKELVINGRKIQVKEARPQMRAWNNIIEISAAGNCINTTVYVGNVTANLTKEEIEPLFVVYGPIRGIKIFPEKKFCFVVFYTHVAAAYAIYHNNRLLFNGLRITCDWGRDEYSTVNYPFTYILAPFPHMIYWDGHVEGRPTD